MSVKTDENRKRERGHAEGFPSLFEWDVMTRISAVSDATILLWYTVTLDCSIGETENKIKVDHKATKTFKNLWVTHFLSFLYLHFPQNWKSLVRSQTKITCEMNISELEVLHYNSANVFSLYKNNCALNLAEMCCFLFFSCKGLSYVFSLGHLYFVREIIATWAPSCFPGLWHVSFFK